MEELPTPSKLGLNERMALFEQKQATQAAGQAAGKVRATVGGKAAAVECETKSNDPTPPPPEPAPQPQALSLKERMALLQGGSSEGASISAKAAGSAPSVKDHSPVAPSAPSHVGSSNSPAPAAPAGGLHDRLKVFEGADTQNKQNLPSPAADMGGVQGKAGGLQDRLKLFAGAETQSKPEPTKQASAKSPTLQHCQPAKQASQEMRPQSLSLSISERMSALQCGAAATGDRATTACPVVSKRPVSMNPASANTSKDAAYPAAAAAAAAAAEPAPESRMSLKERMALLQQQEKKDDDRPHTNAGGDRRTSSEGRNVDALLESTCFRDLSNQSSNQMRDTRDADANRILQIAANRRSEQPENPHFRNSATISKLSVQAREVAEALGGLPPEEEEVEEKEVAEGQVKSVIGRVTMFESGDMAAGWDVEKKCEKEVGRLGGQPKKGEAKVDQTSLDVNDIKNRWKNGNVKPEDKTKKNAAEEALFRCHVAVSTRGGVADIQNRMLAKAEGRPPEVSPPHKPKTKVQELAEEIHFDPNTMMPGAQHPSLNYNATESSLRASEWRNFAQAQAGYGGLDDDDDLPPPTSNKTGKANPQSIGEQMRALKERAAQPIEERMAASLASPGLSRSSQSLKNKMNAGDLLKRKGLM